MPNESFITNVELYKRGFFEEIEWVDIETSEVFRFHPKQIQALRLLNNNTTSEIGYGGAARGGKSLLICADALFSAYAYEGITNLIGRKKLDNLFDTTWQTMQSLYRSFGILQGGDVAKASKYKKRVEFSNGSSILLKNLTYEPSDPEMADFGSLEIVRAYIDQAEQVDVRVINKVQERAGTHRLCPQYGLTGKKLDVFNPAKNHVNERFWIPYRDNTEGERRKFIRALPSDNPSQSAQDWVKQKTKDYHTGVMSETEYQKQVLGNFDYDDDPLAMLNFSQISDVFTNTKNGTGRYMIVDPAGMGKDEELIVVFDGFDIIHYKVYPQSTGKETVQRIRETKALFNIPNRRICYDAVGAGTGVSGHFHNAIGFVSNSQARETIALTDEQGRKTGKRAKKYASLRDECGFKLAELIEKDMFSVSANLSKIDIENFKKDLGQLKRVDVESGKPLQILSKKYIVKNIGRSPSWLDILLQKCVFHLTTKKRVKSQNYSV